MNIFINLDPNNEIMVSAVGVIAPKPHPAGLQKVVALAMSLMSRAGVNSQHQK